MIIYPLMGETTKAIRLDRIISF